MLGHKFTPQHDEAILSLQYCKLLRHTDGSAEEWIGRLRITEIDQRQRKQFINDINDHRMTVEIIRADYHKRH